MALKSLEILFSKKIKKLLNFAFFFILIYLIPSFFNERLHNKLSMLAESAIEHILMAVVWLYAFESVFRQVLDDFLFVVYLLFFL